MLHPHAFAKPKPKHALTENQILVEQIKKEIEEKLKRK